MGGAAPGAPAHLIRSAGLALIVGITAACAPPPGDEAADPTAEARAVAEATDAQLPDVIQIVTFRFQPGQAADAIEVFRDQALPLYQENPFMLEFRGYREVESPEPLDLVVISRFAGMAGMDQSNDRLRSLAADAGMSIGSIYGAISEGSLGHTDEFVELTDGGSLGSMDGERLVLLEYLEIPSGPGPAGSLIQVMTEGLEGAAGGLAGNVVVANGWSHFRMSGVRSLDTVHRLARQWGNPTAAGDVPVARRKRVVLARLDELSVR